MNPLETLGIVAFLIYSVLVDLTFLKIFSVVLAVYLVLTQFGSFSKHNDKWRKINIASWSAPNQPELFAELDWDVEKAEKYLEKKRKESKISVTLSHLVGICMARTLNNFPEVNCRLSCGNFYPKEEIDISYLIACEDGRDVGSCTIQNGGKKSIEEYAKELMNTSKSIRTAHNAEHKQRGVGLLLLPTFVIDKVLYAVGYVAGQLGIPLRMFGMKRYPFGTCLITSIGMLGYEGGLAPIPPFTQVPMIVTVGRVEKKPVVVNDKIELKDVVLTTLTIDSRYMDLLTAGQIYKRFHEILHNPEEFLSEEQHSQ